MSEKRPSAFTAEYEGEPSFPLEVVIDNLLRDNLGAFHVSRVEQDQDILQDKYVLRVTMHVYVTSDQMLALSRGERVKLGLDATVTTPPPSADDEEDDEKDLYG